MTRTKKEESMHRVDTLYDTLAVETRYFEYLSSATAYANDHYNEPDVMEIIS